MILKRVWDVRMLIGGVVDVFSVVATTFDEACKEARRAIDENFDKKKWFFIESIDWTGRTVLVEESSSIKPIISQEENQLNNDKMSVYRCFRQGAYAGGVILVAARSVQEAFDTLGNCKELDYMTYENEDGELVSDGYPISKWELVPDLHVDAVTPHVILENSYAE